MRLILFIAGAITFGAVGVTRGVIPLPAQVLQAILAFGGTPPKVGIINVRPVEANNGGLPQILKGHTPSTVPGASFRDMNGAGGIGPGGFASSLLSEFQQSNTRIQDMATYAHNPASHGTPPR